MAGKLQRIDPCVYGAASDHAKKLNITNAALFSSVMAAYLAAQGYEVSYPIRLVKSE